MSHTSRSLLRRFSLAVVSASLLGCNAAANLDAVSGEKSKAVVRSDQFQAVAANQKVIVGVGANGVVVTSGDGAKSWSRALLAGSPSLIALSACPDGSFVALDFYRKVWVAQASGKGWRPVELKSAANPLALTCDTQGRYWVAGSNSTILMSADRGASWKETTLGQDVMLTTIQFLDGSHGVVTGEFGTLLTTADGGATWQARTRIAKDFYPYAAFFTDPQTGWVSGLAGAILHTADGGKTWNKQVNKVGAPMFGFVQHGGDIYAMGGNGLMLRLAQGEWMPVPQARPAPYLRAAVSLNPKELLVAGGAGVLDTISPAGATAAAQN